MNWDDLRFLLALSRAGSLSQAAIELSVNHSTVSRRIHSLEEQVGTRLFDKTSDGYAVTTAGEELQRVAERIENELHGLDRAVLGQDERLSGSLRFTTVDVAAAIHAPDITSFTRRYPQIDLEAVVDNSLRSLTRREADVALRMSNEPPETLIGRRVARAEFALYGARSLVERMGRDRDLGDYPWLAWDASMGAKLTERWMQRHVPNARICCRLDSAMFFLAAVEAGMGVAFLLCHAGDSRPSLERLRPVEPGFGMDMWLLTHPDLRHTARVRAFMNHMAGAVAAHGDRYAGKPALQATA